MQLVKVFGQQFGPFLNYYEWNVTQGVTGIVGHYDGFHDRSNGTGKTKLITSILYALYGEGSFNVIDDLINDTAKSDPNIAIDMFAGVSIFSNGNTYEIIRGIKGSKSYLTLTENSIVYGDNSTTITAKNEKIKSILGMDYHMFSAASFSEQKNIDKIIEADAKVYLNKSLNLDFVTYLISEALKLSNKDKESLKEIESTLNTLSSDLDSKKKVLESKIKEQGAYGDISKIESTIESEKKKIIECNDKLKVVENYESLKKDYDSKLNSLESNKRTINHISSVLIPEHEQNLSCSNELLKSNNIKLKSATKKVSDLDAEISDQTLYLEDIINKVNCLTKDSNDIKVTIGVLTSKMNSYKSGACPACDTNISSEYVDSKKEKLISEIATWQISLNEIEKNIELNISIRDKTKTHISSLVSLKSKEEEIVRAAKADIDEDKEYIDKADSVREAFQKQIDTLIQSNELLSKEIDSLKSNLDLVTAGETSELIAKQRKISEDIISGCKGTLQAYSELSGFIQAQKISVDKAIKDYQDAESCINALKLIYKMSLDRLNTLKNLHEHLFSTASELIEFYSNEFYHMVEPDFKIKIYKDKSKKSEPIVIDFICDGHKRSFKSLSGGQQVVVCIALRVGIAKTIMDRSDMKIDFICLDEPYESLDNYNRELVKTALVSLESMFKQIILISHTPDINDCHNIVQVVMDKTKNSTIRVVA
jgi:DNA repair exonuclease SbcCD ATPase subunit